MDTIKYKKFLNLDVYTDTQLRDQMKRGAELIVNDSVDLGMEFIGESLDQLLKTNAMFREMDYASLELFSIVRDFGIATLSKEEKKFRDLVIDGIVSNDFESIEKKATKTVLQNKDSELLIRIHLMVLFVVNDRNIPNEELDEIYSMIPGNGLANILKGQNLQDEERYQESIPYLTRAIDANPMNASAYLKRGDCYLDLDEDSLAIDDYTMALKLFPQNELALNHRGDAYYYTDQYPQAIDDYTRAIELNPGYKYYWKDRGNAYISMEEYSNAI
jgi:tetratricopeptide (TPR) repeat protein